MEDESGLELSLGLGYGGSSSKSKSNDVPPDPKIDPKIEEGSNSKLIGGNINLSDVSIKNFFETHGKEKNNQLSHHETFLAMLGKCSAPATDASSDVHRISSQSTRYQDMQVSNNRTDIEEEKSVPNKRKLQFEDINSQKKHEKTDNYVDIHGKKPTGITSVRNSRVSAATEDGSFGENGDATESEAEGSTSWLASQREESSRCSDAPKYTDKHVLTDPNGVSSQPQKAPVSRNESNPEPGKLAYGIPVPFQPVTLMTVPYPVPVNLLNAASAPNATGFPSTCVMQLMPFTNGERPAIQTMNTNNSQIAFGYPTVQLPTLETNFPWAICPQPPHADGAPKPENSGHDAKILHGSVQLPRSSSAALAHEKNSQDLVKGSGTHVGEGGTSTQTEDERKINSTFRQTEIINRPVVDGFPPEGLNIRPGLETNVKFGGCGSFPDLPWVSTTGTGPNGKTISGVTYKYNKNQIKIVCACHGSHMTPEEFIQHANADAANQENNTNLV